MSRVFDTPLLTSDQSWDRVLAAGLPIALVMMNGAASTHLAETLQEMASEYAGDLLVVKADLEGNPEIRRKYAVRRAPTLVTIRDGEVQAKVEAVVPDLARAHVAHLLGRGPEAEQPERSQSRPESGFSGAPMEITDESFERLVAQADLPVLVDFWAPWCGPCRMVEPIVERLASESAGKLRVGKLNVDQNPRTAGRFGITGIPSMIVFQDGQVADQWTGALPEPQLRSRLSRWL